MTEQFYTDLDNTRERFKLDFYKRFNSAQSDKDLVLAYASYCGALEGLLDTLEIGMRAGDYK